MPKALRDLLLACAFLFFVILTIALTVGGIWVAGVAADAAGWEVGRPDTLVLRLIALISGMVGGAALGLTLAFAFGNTRFVLQG